jgi:N-acetylmuramoyl-L-alanine amidase
MQLSKGTSICGSPVSGGSGDFPGKESLMIARAVGLFTVAVALLGWLSGYPLSLSPSQLSVETDRDRVDSRNPDLPGSETLSHGETDWRSSYPEEWKCSGESGNWKYIVLHHTATDHADVESINEAHLKRKDRDGHSWLGIGYHFVIGNGQGMGDGEVEATFRWREQLAGAHAGDEDYNQHGIGVVLVGNFEQTTPTAAQLESVKRLVGFLKKECNITSDRIVGHREIKATACPGSLFPLAEVAETQIEE